MAKKIPYQLEKHGHIRTDEYYWMRDRDNPEVIEYLEAENEYTESVLAHTADLQQALFDEIKGRIKPSDASVPYRLRDYYYYIRFEAGKEYAILCRKKGSLEAPEEVVLDENKLAAEHTYYHLGATFISSGQDLLAFAADTVGRRFYNIGIKDLNTGHHLDDIIPETTGSMAWANDNRTLFYVKQEPDTLRPYQVWRHIIGDPAAEDRLVYEEVDETFSVGISKTKSRRFLIIGCYQTQSTEMHYLSADRPEGEFQIFQPRERDHEYGIDHFGDSFYIMTNDQAPNYRLMKTPAAQTGREHWVELLPHRADIFLEDFEIFQDHLVVEERNDGLTRLNIIPWDGRPAHYLDFGEPTYEAYVGTNPELDSNILRFGYNSLTTPNSIYDYNMDTHHKTLMKQDEVLGDFDSANYRSERLHATAPDGVRVPISLVYRKGTLRNGNNPLLLYGYGSYGHFQDPTFSAPRLSLLDRGFVYAIAHIRGGQELGRHWYEDGKLLKKKNTFTDFIACAEFLIQEKLTSPEHLFAIGGSAGGLLVGAVINMRPELFKGVIAAVPFVDVVTTMLDESIPLTTSEYDEWGNPNQKEYYDYMLSYSPYDNVTAQDYPHLLVTTGLHDSQVQYWEPAKWVARLRDKKTDDHRLLLKTYMDVGHSGATGRFKRHQDTALEFAFLLDLAGKA